MKITNNKIKIVLALTALAVTGYASHVATQDISPDPVVFMNPPISARPGAFWAWLEGHVSLDRITYELEEMKAKAWAAPIYGMCTPISIRTR